MLWIDEFMTFTEPPLFTTPNSLAPKMSACMTCPCDPGPKYTPTLQPVASTTPLTVPGFTKAAVKSTPPRTNPVAVQDAAAATELESDTAAMNPTTSTHAEITRLIPCVVVRI